MTDKPETRMDDAKRAEYQMAVTAFQGVRNEFSKLRPTNYNERSIVSSLIAISTEGERIITALLSELDEVYAKLGRFSGHASGRIDLAEAENAAVREELRVARKWKRVADYAQHLVWCASPNGDCNCGLAEILEEARG